MVFYFLKPGTLLKQRFIATKEQVPGVTISASVMKLLIISTLCLGFVACSPRDRMVLIYPGHAPMLEKAGKTDVLHYYSLLTSQKQL